MRFGPEIVPHLVAWAGSPDAAWADVIGALFVLSDVVDRWDETLSSEARAGVRDVARFRLGPGAKRFTGSTHRGFVLEEAITLASVMRDSDLLAILEEIAEEDHEVLEGLAPETVAVLRDMARRGLAGSLLETRDR
jgi:hypothetical protein